MPTQAAPPRAQAAICPGAGRSRTAIVCGSIRPPSRAARVIASTLPEPATTVFLKASGTTSVAANLRAREVAAEGFDHFQQVTASPELVQADEWDMTGWTFHSAAWTDYSCQMFPRPTLWAHHFRVFSVGAIDDFRMMLVPKVVGAFSNIEEEADAEADRVHGELASVPFDLNTWICLGDIDDLAMEEGIAYEHRLTAMRQAALNMLAMTLYHLFEQQQRYFLDREPHEGPKQPPSQTEKEWDERMAVYGINCASFSCARSLTELKEVANAIKHSKGRASRELLEMRPELFTSEALRRVSSEADLPSQVRVVANIAGAPLAGQYIFVTEEHVGEWCDAVAAYWTTLGAIVDEYRKRLF